MADFTVVHQPGKAPVIVTAPCIHCGNTAHLVMDSTADEKALLAMSTGVSVQQAFWHWTPDQRELLISGTHAHCYEAIFADFDDEEND
jgi:hypothetical protein